MCFEIVRPFVDMTLPLRRTSVRCFCCILIAGGMLSMCVVTCVCVSVTEAVVVLVAGPCDPGLVRVAADAVPSDEPRRMNGRSSAAAPGAVPLVLLSLLSRILYGKTMNRPFPCFVYSSVLKNALVEDEGPQTKHTNKQHKSKPRTCAKPPLTDDG